ncbi:MAG: hypothetical protein U9Q67_04190 [Patescibacteria group bacterium]|nr:hypothetical protein [Patescibacteria group bacterium]
MIKIRGGRETGEKRHDLVVVHGLDNTHFGRTALKQDGDTHISFCYTTYMTGESHPDQRGDTPIHFLFTILSKIGSELLSTIKDYPGLIDDIMLKFAPWASNENLGKVVWDNNGVSTCVKRTIAETLLLVEIPDDESQQIFATLSPDYEKIALLAMKTKHNTDSYSLPI